jgi:hypothetical protein
VSKPDSEQLSKQQFEEPKGEQAAHQSHERDVTGIGSRRIVLTALRAQLRAPPQRLLAFPADPRHHALSAIDRIMMEGIANRNYRVLCTPMPGWSRISCSDASSVVLS